MAKLVLNDIDSLANTASAKQALNENFTDIEAAIENTLSRDGTTPNQMQADIDMNSNDLLNVQRVDAVEYYKAGIPLEQTVAYANKRYQLLSGTGVQTVFTLDVDPGSLGNLEISVDGAVKRPGVDFNYNGTALEFVAAPAAGTNNILIRYDQALPTGVTDASGVSYTQAGAGAVARSAEDYFRDKASVMDYGAQGDGIAVTSAVSISSGTNALTVAGASFGVQDVGKAITVRGAGAAGAPLYALITAYVSPTQVTLSGNASTTLTASTQRVFYGTDDWLAFQRAANALPAEGGTIVVPSAIYMIHAQGVNSGVKSIFWDISSGAVFEGALGGSTSLLAFPRANTNESIVPYGPFAQVRSETAIEGGNTVAVTSALFEALPPSTFGGNSVGLYAGARSASPDGYIWATNFLVQADPGFGLTAHGIELDANIFTTNPAALIKGLGISGIGTSLGSGGRLADVAIEIQHGVGWKRGIDILNSDIAMQVRSTCLTGISMYAPAGSGAVLNAKQRANGTNGIVIERFTDSAPTGSFLKFQTAAGVDVFSVDMLGTTTAAGIVVAGGFSTTGTTDTFNALLRFPAPAGGAGQVGLGNETRTVIGAAGGASAPPATPVKYLVVTEGGTKYSIPLYTYA